MDDVRHSFSRLKLSRETAYLVSELLIRCSLRAEQPPGVCSTLLSGCQLNDDFLDLAEGDRIVGPIVS